MAAGDEPAQREVFTDIGARRNLGDPETAILHGLPRSKADDRLVLGRNQPQAPILDRDMACIDRAGKDFRDPLDMHLVVAVARKRRLRFQKPFDLRHAVEAARGVALKGLLYDGRQRLVGDKHLAVTGDALVSVSKRCLKHPIAIHGAGAHPVFGLLSVLLTLVLRDGGEKVFPQDAVGVIAELHRRAFQLAARFGEEIAQIPMPAHVLREAVDMVDDDHAGVLAVRPKKFHDILDAETRVITAGHTVGKHLDNLVSLVTCVFAATGFLTAQSVPFAHLFFA